MVGPYRTAAAVLLCSCAWVLSGGAARAVPAMHAGFPPRIRLPGAPIPANGAIVFESLDSVEPIAQVLAEGDVPVPGIVREVGALRFGGLIFAWVPDSPLKPGTYSVVSMHPWDSSLATIQDIEVIDPIEGAPPLLMSEPSASEWSTRSESFCCTDPVSMSNRPCTVIEQISVIHVEGGLSSSDPLSTVNQFLFRYRAADGSGPATVTDRFMPIDQLPPVIFESEADEYCFVLTALNVATLEEHVYTELPSCAERGTLHVGPTQFEPDPVVLDPQVCPFPPPELRSDWCEANEAACSGDPAVSCEQYQHVCSNGPLPQVWVDMGIPGRINLAENTRMAPSESSASCAVQAPPGSGRDRGVAMVAVLVALGIARSRRSKRIARLK